MSIIDSITGGITSVESSLLGSASQIQSTLWSSFLPSKQTMIEVGAGLIGVLIVVKLIEKI